MLPIKRISGAPFLGGVFLLSFSILIFQILQTRILSVMAWYYMAFFAISVAMLGMTVGAVWVYLRSERFKRVALPVTLTRFALLCAVAMPASVAVQFCLVTTTAVSLTTLLSWSLLLTAMGVPYVFCGVVVSLALTRSPFPTGQVYGVDLLGAGKPDARPHMFIANNGNIATLVLSNAEFTPEQVQQLRQTAHEQGFTVLRPTSHRSRPCCGRWWRAMIWAR